MSKKLLGRNTFYISNKTEIEILENYALLNVSCLFDLFDEAAI